MIVEKTLWVKMKTSIANSFPELARRLHFTLFPTEAKDFFTELIMTTIKYREENNIKRKDFLQMMIDLKNSRIEEKYIGKIYLNYLINDLSWSSISGDGTELTINEMIAQCFVFFNAGFDTTSSAISFCLFELARNQHIQEKVRTEMFEVLHKCNNRIDYEAVKELKYLEQVLNGIIHTKYIYIII